ncbi:MAG: NAD-dependent succinate-semialdehyde dehydrogenase [Candidatus Kapabacteria bacterium]|nr:NAD-dependent succinate-semialdehyde dehydrogenase [Candidatus Kapabacteria bacterium]
MSFTTINPADGSVIKEYQELTAEQIKAKIAVTHAAYGQWRKTDINYRTGLMHKAAAVLREGKDKYAELMAIEMGKPIAQGIAETEKCAWVCDYYADNAAEQLKDMPIKTEMSESFVTYQPLGTVLAIMPWNFPFWQVFRFAAPTLMAGNAGMLKHSRNTMGCGKAIEDVFRKAGFPEGLFSNLVIGSAPVADIIADERIIAVTLTGSTPVGKKVAECAGQNLKKTVLELGGSDPYVILEDADLEVAAVSCVTGRMINSGQSCIAAKRFIVVESVREKFEELCVAEMKKYVTGDPFDPKVNVGPQARKDLQTEVAEQVSMSVDVGAKCLLGGEIIYSGGFFYPPTILTNVKKGMPAYDEEIFGPVASIISAKDEAEAIAIANDTEFGLGAAVFTEDIERGKRIAREELHAGACFVNDFVRSDPRLPFGGIKQSGYGRELSLFGIREFVNIKSVAVK